MVYSAYTRFQIKFLFSRVYVFLPDGHFLASPSKLTEWTHIVLNYIGPNNGQGIQIYYNGQEVESDTIKDAARSHSAGDGRVVLGRLYTNSDDYYGSVEIDELLFFNQTLSNDDINALYNAV